MVCKDCGGSGTIRLLTSVVPCDCRKTRTIVSWTMRREPGGGPLRSTRTYSNGEEDSILIPMRDEDRVTGEYARWIYEQKNKRTPLPEVRWTPVG